MKLPLWATICTVGGIAVLCAMGAWQTQRLEWKRGLLARLDEIYATAPLDNTGLLSLTAAPAGDMPFRARAAATGRYDHSRSVMIGPRTHNGRSGFHLITPLTLDGGGTPAGARTLLVNRGWVDTPPSPGSSPAAVTVMGLLRHPETPNMFVPPNDPAGGLWYRPAIDEIARAQGISRPLPFILYAEAETPAAPAIRYHAGPPPLANNHRGYAFFWFGMAGLLALIYALRFLYPAWASRAENP